MAARPLDVAPAGPVTKTVPSCSTSTCAPVASIMELIIFPPGPMTSRILSGFIFRLKILGASPESSARGLEIAFSITSIIFPLAAFASARTSFKISSVTPRIFTSIWTAVMPSEVPAVLKSMSP